eukprot:scaffold272374_cov45-Prasinocladus_malaysianus.AAC.1
MPLPLLGRSVRARSGVAPLTASDLGTTRTPKKRLGWLKYGGNTPLLASALAKTRPGIAAAALHLRAAGRVLACSGVPAAEDRRARGRASRLPWLA